MHACYLGDWIARQKQDEAAKIDGVRLNIRPFLTVLAIKTKDARVLRARPKIKRQKDWGKEPQRAMQLALYVLLDEEPDRLAGKHLDRDYFNTLLSDGDPIRDLLLWLDQGDAFKTARDENAWLGFVEVCKSQLKAG